MRTIDAIKTAANKAGIPITHIGIKLHRNRGYINTMASKGTIPNTTHLIDILGVCGYGLYAIPDDEKDALPDTAIPINN